MKIKNNLKIALSFLCVISIAVSSLLIVPEAQAETAAALDKITLSDLGFAAEETTYTTLTSQLKYKGASLVGTELVFQASFNEYTRYLTFGKSETWEGIYVRLYSNNDGTDYFQFAYHNGSALLYTDNTYSSDAHFGADSDDIFLGRKMHFKIVTEYYDENSDGTNDGIISKLYVDNKYAAEMKLGINALPSKRFSFSAGITALDAVIEEPDVSDKKEESPTTLKKLSWEDFGIGENVYNYTNGGFSKVGTYREQTSLKNVSFRGKLKFSSENTGLYYGDNPSGYQHGIGFLPQSDGTLKVKSVSGIEFDILDPAKAGLTSFLNQEFELGIDVWVEGENLKMNLFVNGEQYNQRAYIWQGGASYQYFTNAIGLMVREQADSISVIYPQVVIEPDVSPEGLTSITWEDFGMKETKEYTKSMGDAAGFTGTLASELDSLVGTSFRGKVKFTKPNAEKSLFICYGATSKWDWNGVLLIPQADGTLQLKAAGSVLGTLNPTEAGLAGGSFLDTEFELGIDLWEEVDTTDNKNDIKMLVFVNGNQCNMTAFVWEDASAESKVGKACNFLVGADEYGITAILPEPEGETSPEGLTPITWASFGISSGTVYTKAMGDADGFIGTSAIGLESVIGTSFRGKILFDRQQAENSMFVGYGATSKWAWDGILILPQSDGSLQFKAAVGGEILATLEPEMAGVNGFIGEEFELGIDLWQYENDIKLNLFINGVQYKNRTYLWKDAVTNNLVGKACNFRVAKDTDSIKVESIAVDYGASIQPDSSLKKISFSSFNIADGIYGENKNALAVSGGYYDPVRGRSLDGTLFSGYVKFGSQNGAQLNYGGKNSAWEGIAIRSMGDALWLVQGDNLLGTFMPDLAGVKLTDNMINLKLSIVYVDSDKDGQEDDVQLGVWFNDKMYKNEYYYLPDFAPQMGSLLGIYSPTKGLNIEVSTEDVDNSADLSIFYFDENWKTFLTTTGKPRAVYTSLKSVGNSKLKNTSTTTTQKSPETGDDSPIGAFSLLLGISAFAVVMMERKPYNKVEKE